MAAALVLYLVRLDVPAEYVYDEVYHVFTATQYLLGNRDAYLWSTRPPRPDVGYTWNHPPAGLWLIAAGIRLAGDTPFGWRVTSAVAGAAGLAVAYGLGRRLSGRAAVAGLTSALLLVDGLYFVQARTGMLDVFLTVFLMGALWAFAVSLERTAPREVGPLVLTGACLGLALATKWSAAYPAVLMGLVALGRAAGPGGDRRGGLAAPARVRLARGARVAVALGVLPLAIYLIAYLPFFLAGHTAGDFLELQRQIARYHAGLTATHGYQSRWWQWPLALRPVWYHVTYGSGTVAHVYANGNPLLHWAFVPAVGWVTWRWRRARPAAAATLALGFFGQWLPWALVSRVAFAYHFLPAVPFGAIAVAVVAIGLTGRGGLARWLAVAYVAAAALAFLHLFPIYAAVPLSPEAFERRLWLPSWR